MVTSECLPQRPELAETLLWEIFGLKAERSWRCSYGQITQMIKRLEIVYLRRWITPSIVTENQIRICALTHPLGILVAPAMILCLWTRLLSKADKLVI